MDFIFDPSLVLYLPLYRLDGSSFMSKDAYGHLCTVTGASWRPYGREFDGTDDKIAIANHAFLDLAGDYTIIGWVRFDKVDASQILICHNDDAGNEKQWSFYLTSTGNVMKFLRSSNGSSWNLTAITASNAKVIDTWYCVAISKNAADSFQIYENGATDGSAQGSSGAYFATDVDGSIGASIDDGADLDGRVGEVWVYSRTLNPLEIQRNYLATKWRYR